MRFLKIVREAIQQYRCVWMLMKLLGVDTTLLLTTFFLFTQATWNCLREGFLVQGLHILELIERVLRFMRWFNSLLLVVDLQDVLVVA